MKNSTDIAEEILLNTQHTLKPYGAGWEFWQEKLELAAERAVPSREELVKWVDDIYPQIKVPIGANRLAWKDKEVRDAQRRALFDLIVEIQGVSL